MQGLPVEVANSEEVCLMKSKYFDELFLESLSNTDVDQDVGGSIDNLHEVNEENVFNFRNHDYQQSIKNRQNIKKPKLIEIFSLLLTKELRFYCESLIEVTKNSKMTFLISSSSSQAIPGHVK